jgi:hypothetical protein
MLHPSSSNFLLGSFLLVMRINYKKPPVAGFGQDFEKNFSGQYGGLEVSWKREALDRKRFQRVEEPEPRLWRGSLDSSWSVPPHCEYASRSPLRAHFSHIKTELNLYDLNID